ncbi:MAG: hypothetical protein ACXACR_14665 [Candidatus Hodarchaeales archaeon]|jgi:hypothetical protein
MKTKTVKPYAMLYSQGREYFLLFPEPLEQDSWEQSGTYRFVVVPRTAVSSVDAHGILHPYPHARHIVTTSFTIEFADMPEIKLIRKNVYERKIYLE